MTAVPSSDASCPAIAGRRFCRTPEDSFAAGWADGAHDPPLTVAQRTKLVALLAPHIRPPATLRPVRALGPHGSSAGRRGV